MARRRLILLAALVLGVSAMVTALSTPPGDGSGGETERESGGSTGTAPPRPARELRELTVNASEPRTVTVARGTHVLLRIEVAEAGEVAIPRLGLTGFGEPGTPAAFDILAERPGRYEVTFDPAGQEPRQAGTLVVD
jgi:hypothetical protein